MTKNTAVIVLVALLVVGVALAGTVALVNPGIRASAQEKPSEPAQRQFSVVMMVFGSKPLEYHRWVPGTIVVNQGDTVILKVTNADREGSHGFSIAAYGIDKRKIEPGATETFQFVADKAGIFRFACSEVGCTEDHADQIGQLVVLGK